MIGISRKKLKVRHLCILVPPRDWLTLTLGIRGPSPCIILKSPAPEMSTVTAMTMSSSEHKIMVMAKNLKEQPLSSWVRRHGWMPTPPGRLILTRHTLFLVIRYLRLETSMVMVMTMSLSEHYLMIMVKPMKERRLSTWARLRDWRTLLTGKQSPIRQMRVLVFRFPTPEMSMVTAMMM